MSRSITSISQFAYGPSCFCPSPARYRRLLDMARHASITWVLKASASRLVQSNWISAMFLWVPECEPESLLPLFIKFLTPWYFALVFAWIFATEIGQSGYCVFLWRSMRTSSVLIMFLLWWWMGTICSITASRSHHGSRSLHDSQLMTCYGSWHTN